MNVLSSAFPFGYGPASKMLVIAKQLRNSDAIVKVDFVGDDVALTFARQNAQHYNSVMSFDDISDIDASGYDLAICVMNHYFMIWAYLHNIPTVFIDSLFWFWEWDNEERLILADNFIKDLQDGISFNRAMRLSEKFNSHELKYIAYRLADTVLTQDFAEEQYMSRSHPVRDSITRTQIGPIVDTSYVNHESDRKNVLISLAGTYSPLNREPQALAYADLVLDVFDNFINNLPTDTDIIMTANPNLVDKIDLRNKRIRLTSLSHDEFLRQLATSKILFTPAGVTTIYESICYGTPIVFLPEQHDGHYKNYMRLTDDKKYDDIFPELLFNTRLKREESSNPDLEILNIQKLITEKLNDSKHIDELKKVLDNLTEVASSKSGLGALADQQRHILHEVSTEAFDINNYIAKEET